ncbi:MFS transporter [Pseudomonas syringae pv. tomato]|uniref:MFS transporter n=1 Tax=Pseudomonas syringae pv. tomato TaxID=323 RepID=A0AB36KSC0_PSEUB|nr:MULTISPECIES: MFS transporter [Pseudomonas syringae group]KPB84548.1 Major facilitator family transporter [Pseudomonas syringae pv. maculicola]MBI6850079.1 MFS transporter [Pseudomonas syringae]MBX6508842.1 MFS transporter [Pseudomonas syringae pv. tomato]OPE58652.1 MFS transporter [Pseudomonas syringae pv. tomato]RMV01498.1 Major facilitator family transporter [Pseudomonas syringae pv. tomato]
MNAFESTPQQTTTAHPPAWGAVFSMALCVVVLIASEFMPVSLLTPIAQDLGISQGQAGQAISISGFFAVLISLLNTSLTGHLDRKHVLLGFSLLLLVSGVIVTLASSGWLFMTGRALLGVAIGGFWSMSTATVMKLVPKESVAKGLALINGGNALAATVAAPLGSFMGQYIGWRGAFFLVVPLAALAFAWQWLSLPAMNNAPNSRARNPFQLLRTPQIAIGMTAIMLLFMGQFAVFTYLRPFLEDVTGVSVTTLSLMLLLLGASGLLGTYLIGGLLQKRIYACLIAIPLVMAVLALALTGLGHSPLAVAAVLAAWGLIATPAPVAWGLWLSRALPDDAEAGGGLMVATIQMAITAGAGIGGALFDNLGWWSPFAFGGVVLAASAVLAGAARRNAGIDQQRHT